MIEVTNISFKYGRRPALREVSFSVKRNQIFGLLGPNGGGKTTLFRILCTLLVPDTGAATIGGVDVKADPRSVRELIGIVFQSHSLDQDLTVEENLTCQGCLYGLRGNDLKSRVEESMHRFALEDRMRELVRTLSGGLKRRLELAKGLLHHPTVLLLDEPTFGLDPRARREFWSYLETLQVREQMTILLTTHLMEEADRCDDLVILNEGRVVATGSPGVLKEKIGGDVIVLQTADPEGLCEKIRNQFSCQPGIINGTVRLELPRGHAFASKLMEAYGEQIESVTVGKPTLEDVFIHETGQRL